MLHLYNTLTGSKDGFEPLQPGKARMYVCGVTVYDYCHIGHARSALVFDVLRRYLEHSGFTVEFAKNFTDVDDKIIKRAHEQGVSCGQITDKYIQAYYADMEHLGVRRATLEPRATEHIPDIVALVEKLLVKGIAYCIEGDVYFQVDRYPMYGRLSKRKIDDLQAGARVDVDQRKRHPMDFALWKSSKPDEPFWDSPWGAGRPGWHIECSAMAMRHLGETFDIHGGGMDLIFPHHENEIAQSCGATGKEFARYWVHNGFVQINQEKMSKSLGNFFTIREIFSASEWPASITGEMLRYFLLSTHYRSPLDFSDQALREAKGALNGLYGLFDRLNEPASNHGSADGQMRGLLTQTREAFAEAMDDDLNTPNAVAVLQKLRGESNKAVESGLSGEMRHAVRQEFRALGAVLGLLQLDSWQFKSQLQPASPDVSSQKRMPLSEADIAGKIAARLEAKKTKNYGLADQLRAELASHGITIEDRPDGTSRGDDNLPEVIYGLHAVREALRADVRPLQRVLVLATDRQFGDIVRLAKERRIPVHIEPRAAFDRFVPDGHHQGIIGVVAAKAYADPDDILSSAQAKGQIPLLVVLDGVEDPHNLGAILRTAEASGVQGVFIPERRAVGLTSVVAKASAGAVDYMPVGRVPNLSRLIERLQDAGMWVYALDPEGSKVYTALDFRGPVALVFGGEGKGVRPGVREACDDTAHIPMLGRVGSLNVSASAAAVLYEALRQRRAG